MVKKKLYEAENVRLIKARFVILGVIGTMQPVDLGLIQSAVQSEYSSYTIKNTVEQLLHQGLIKKLEDGSLWLTYNARRNVFSGKFSKVRDIRRMFFLIKKSKGGGGNA